MLVAVTRGFDPTLQILTPHGLGGLQISLSDDFPYPALIPEGRDAIYDVILTARPTNSVTVNVDDESVLTSATPSQLVFEPENWNVPQQVTVSAVQDVTSWAEPQQANITFALSSDDVNFDSIASYLTVGVEDDDQSKHSAICCGMDRLKDN